MHAMNDLSCDALLNVPSSVRVLELQDLQIIENNLCCDEKISLLFLLYGYEDPDTGYDLVQQCYADSKCSNFLLNWARTTSNWQDMIREALVILQCYSVLKILGLDLHDEYTRFLPQNNECSIYIHPMIKVLYYVCENLTVETSVFIKKVQQNATIFEEFLYDKNLEIHILLWIKLKVINMGYQSDRNVNRKKTDVNALLSVLKNNGLHNLHELLSNTQDRLNKVNEHAQSQEQNELNKCVSYSTTYNNLSTSANNSMQYSTMLVNDAERLASLRISNESSSATNSTLGVSPLQHYHLDPNNMGVCLIIDQKDFSSIGNVKVQQDKKLDTRHGTEMDRERLSKVFMSYGYRIIIKTNLTHTEIESTIRSTADSISEKDSSLIVCILSHGQRDAVFGVNSMPVKINKIIELTRSESLKEKPSIVIVQACQTSTKGNDADNTDFATDSPRDLQDASLPKLSDYLLCMSTVEGFASVRDKKKGSWFIQELCNVLEIYGEQMDMTHIATKICDNCQSKRWHGYTMVPQWKCCFRYLFRLPTRPI